MGGANREGECPFAILRYDPEILRSCASSPQRLTPPGGKAKPLKQAKKDKREMDDDDKAFLEKKRAGKECRHTPQKHGMSVY